MGALARYRRSSKDFTAQEIRGAALRPADKAAHVFNGGLVGRDSRKDGAVREGNRRPGTADKTARIVLPC